MQPVSREEALCLVRRANTLSREEIAGLQQERLQELVTHARKHSALYRNKYAHLPEAPALEDLPIITKQELTGQMQDVICDPDFSVEELETYIGDTENLGKPFMEKYSVATTSGTTGEPLRMLRDQRHITINGAITQVRFLESPLFRDCPQLTDPRARFASVLATGGYHAAYMAFENRRKGLEAQGITGTMELLPIGEPIKHMVRRLNGFQPEVVSGYPSFMQILAGEQREKRLHISPKAIVCSAEQLTDDVREMVEGAFGCPVGNIFCSTEGGEVALLCDHGRMHLNPDWIIVEPVDRDNNPVPPGTMSDAILVTNLTNAVQPIIRYKVDDSIILHDEPCGCGLPFPFADILGRTDDLPEFAGTDGSVRLSPIVFYDAVLEIEGISIYQFVQTGPASLTIRVEYLEDAAAEAVDRDIRSSVSGKLEANGLGHVQFDIVREPPLRAKK